MPAGKRFISKLFNIHSCFLFLKFLAVLESCLTDHCLDGGLQS